MTQTIINQNQIGNQSNIYILPGNTVTTPVIKTTTWHFLTPYNGESYPVLYHFETNDFSFLPGRKVDISSIGGDATYSYISVSGSPHGFNTNDRVLITTVDTSYNGTYAITYVDAYTFRITHPAGSTTTGYAYIGARVKSLHPEYYKYNISYCVSFRTTVTNVLDHTSFEFMLKSTGDIANTQVQVDTPDSAVWHQAYGTTSPYALDLPQDEELVWAYSASSSTNPILIRSLIIKIERIT